MRDVFERLDRNIVTAKMDEYLRSPQDFFKKYGGGPSLKYDLLDDQNNSYPPAAIVQASLGTKDFKGGLKDPGSAGVALRFLGFRVVEKGFFPRTNPSRNDDATIEQIVENEKVSLRKQRVGAAQLRKFTLRRRVACEVSGIQDEKVLRVSHIVPWSEDKKERLNPENVILLSALWDLAFDRGIIGFDEFGRVIYGKMSEELKQTLVSTENRALTLSKDRKKFLAIHRDKNGLKRA